MNYKTITILALVLMLAFTVVPVAGKQFVEYPNKYVPIKGDPDMHTYGFVTFTERCGGACQDNLIFVKNKKDNLTFDAFWYPDKTEIPDQNKGWLKVEVMKNGESIQQEFATGEYTACLRHSNGDQPECHDFSAGNAEFTRVSFLGSAISQKLAKGDPVAADVEAELGRGDVEVKWIKLVKTGEHLYTPPCYVVNHPARTHNEYKYQVSAAQPQEESGWVTHVPPGRTVIETRVVTDVAAWDEYVPAVTHVVHHDAITHQDYQAGHVHAREVGGSSAHDFHYNGHKYQITGNSHDAAFMVTGDSGTPASLVTIIDTPAWDETVIDVPAHTVHHDAVTHTEYRYIISPAQSAVISGWVLHVPPGKPIVETRTVVDAPGWEETVCPPAYMVPEYGFEFFLEIDGARVHITNPNDDPVNVGFSLDVNYWIDKRPWDNNAMPNQIEKRVKTYSGYFTGVSNGRQTYHGFLTPDIDNAVQVLGYDGMHYIPYINNERVTSTVWT